ncbi:hypothetical protein EV561_1371, partial [Rhizobium sp. BK376]
AGYSREEPGAGNPPARICEGEAEWHSYSTTIESAHNACEVRTGGLAAGMRYLHGIVRRLKGRERLRDSLLLPQPELGKSALNGSDLQGQPDGNYPTPLASLTKAIAAMGRAETPEQVVETIRMAARSLIGCEGIAIIRRDGDYCHYIEEDASGPWKGHKFPASACISGWSMNRQTVVVPDISKDSRIPGELYAGHLRAGRRDGPCPDRRSDRRDRCLLVTSLTPAQWEVDVLEALAGAAATAIEKTRGAPHPCRSRAQAPRQAARQCR